MRNQSIQNRYLSFLLQHFFCILTKIGNTYKGNVTYRMSAISTFNLLFFNTYLVFTKDNLLGTYSTSWSRIRAPLLHYHLKFSNGANCVFHRFLILECTINLESRLTCICIFFRGKEKGNRLLGRYIYLSHQNTINILLPKNSRNNSKSRYKKINLNFISTKI